MIYLVIAAHPDDEILGCGGTMAKHVKQGHQVNVIIMAEVDAEAEYVKHHPKKIAFIFSILCYKNSRKISFTD